MVGSRVVTAIAILTLACSTDPSDGFDFPDEPTLALNINTLTGSWEQRLLVFIPDVSSLPLDTTVVASAELRRYRFGLDGPDIVRRTTPDTGQAIIRFEQDGQAISWVIGTFEGYIARVTANTLRLQSGLKRPHRWPGDTEDRLVQFQELYLRTQ